MRRPKPVQTISNATANTRHLVVVIIALSAWPTASAGQVLTHTEALDRFLNHPADYRSACTDKAYEVKIEASLPKMKKSGTMSGLKFISGAGHVVYRGLEFTGDSIVKTAVIARFLAREVEVQERRDLGVTELNEGVLKSV